MTKRVLLNGLTIVVFGMTQPLPSQNASKPSACVTEAQVSHSVYVTIRLFSGDKELFVPYCGEGEGGTEHLCNLPTHLQVATRKGWMPVKLRHPDAVLGGVPPDRWRVRRIAAGQWHDFLFFFPKDDFAVETGQRLRYVVDVWPDEQSMRTAGRPIQLATPPFKCP